MLAFKLLLIAATVYLSSWAARRGGHGVAGLVTGMPMIVGPILGLILLDHGAERTRALALATLTCFPATLVHAVVFSHAAKVFVWPLCLLLATLAYLVAAAALSWLDWPEPWVWIVALGSPWVALRLMPDGGLPSRRALVDDTASPTRQGVRIPRAEVLYRIAAAVAMAAVIILGAERLPLSVSGLLLALPIAGAVLPCFTLPRYGYGATVFLLKGFARGLVGFCIFCTALLFLLPLLPAGAAFFLSLAAAACTGWRIKR